MKSLQPGQPVIFMCRPLDVPYMVEFIRATVDEDKGKRVRIRVNGIDGEVYRNVDKNSLTVSSYKAAQSAEIAA